MSFGLPKMRETESLVFFVTKVVKYDHVSLTGVISPLIP